MLRPRPSPAVEQQSDTLDLLFEETRRVYEEQQARIERITTRLTFVVTVATGLFAAGISTLPDHLARLAPLAGRTWQIEIKALNVDSSVPALWYRDEFWLAGLVVLYTLTVIMAFAAGAARTISETPDPETLKAYRDATREETEQRILDAWLAVYAFNDVRVRVKQRRLGWAAVLLVAEALYLGLAVVVAFSA